MKYESMTLEFSVSLANVLKEASWNWSAKWESFQENSAIVADPRDRLSVIGKTKKMFAKDNFLQEVIRLNQYSFESHKESHGRVILWIGMLKRI